VKLSISSHARVTITRDIFSVGDRTFEKTLITRKSIESSNINLFFFFAQKFDETGAVIKRGAYGFGEVFDKTVKCEDRFHTCCDGDLCNKDTKAPCPPLRKY
jgi:hypothetical protein